jgi:hypothetical protein|tara:strand:- start:2834 stop:3517 length:684 start_codon:yes stop_codon:yes gene_type:complete
LKYLSVILITFLYTVGSPTFADTPQVLGWRDLVPKLEPHVNPLRKIDIKLRFDIEYLASIRYWIKTGQISEVDTEYEQGVELEHKFKSNNVDFEPLVTQYNAYLDEIDRRSKLVVEALDGQLVKIPGYALPLETSATAITEFLLVPSIGACIHTPVPPSNQMVFVKLNQSYQTKRLYDPVWITGRIKLEQNKKAVVYNDGESGVESSYTLTGVKIEPYKNEIQITNP